MSELVGFLFLRISYLEPFIERSGLVLPSSITAKDLCNQLESLWCIVFGTFLIFNYNKWQFLAAIHTCCVFCWILFFHFDINPFRTTYTIETFQAEETFKSRYPPSRNILTPRSFEIPPEDPPPLYPSLIKSKYDCVVQPPSVYE